MPTRKDWCICFMDSSPFDHFSLTNDGETMNYETMNYGELWGIMGNSNDDFLDVSFHKGKWT